MKNPDELKGHKNVCAQCGREQAVDERGWRAYLTTDEDEPAEAVVYCPGVRPASSARARRRR